MMIETMRNVFSQRGPRSTDDFPFVVLGDHGFLPQYGSVLQYHEIVERMEHALKLGIGGLSAGSHQVAQAAHDAFQRAGGVRRLVRHVDVPLVHKSGSFDFRRAMARLRHEALTVCGGAVTMDPIIGPFLERFQNYHPLNESDVELLELDSYKIKSLGQSLLDFPPDIITLGGDIFDFCLSSDRTDLVIAFRDLVAKIADRTECPIWLCTYLGFGWRRRLDQLANDPNVFGFMLPMNIEGHGMYPSREELRSAVREIGKPIIAMHVLGIGRLRPVVAIPPLLDWHEIAFTIVGASQKIHIEELANVARVIQLRQDDR